MDYTHYRLCESYREGRFIRNRTLLSVGDLETELPADKIGLLCKRINQVYYEGKTFIISTLRDKKVEALCMEYVSRLREAEKAVKEKNKVLGIEEVYVDKTTNSDVREVGAEWLCRQACGQLLLPEYFETFGWDKQSASLAHRLYREKDGLERHFSNRTNDLFSLDDKILVFDLSNTFFEGRMQNSRLAAFGRSKKKGNDAKQVVFAAVVNPEGFLKESQIFRGNMSDPAGLLHMLGKLKAHRGGHGKKQIVVMDAGIATKDNLAML